MPELIPLPKTPKSSVFKLVPNSHARVSKTNNATAIFDQEGAYWEGVIEIANVREADALVLDGFMASLRGAVGTFLMFDYRRQQLDKAFVGHVRDANQDGNTFVIAGLPPSTTIAEVGERFQLGDEDNTELKILTHALVSNSRGEATAIFESPVRKIPAPGTPIYFKQPKGLFRLADNKQGLSAAQYKNGLVTSWRIKVREAF